MVEQIYEETLYEDVCNCLLKKYYSWYFTTTFSAISKEMIGEAYKVHLFIILFFSIYFYIFRDCIFLTRACYYFFSFKNAFFLTSCLDILSLSILRLFLNMFTGLLSIKQIRNSFSLKTLTNSVSFGVFEF